MLKKITFGVVGLLLLASPLLASADTISDLQAQIQALLAQLSALQNHQTTTNNSDADDYGTGNSQSGPYCPKLSVTLQKGSRDATTGGQVSELQTFLTDYFNLDENVVVGGYFGNLTQKYVVQFQSAQGLPSLGIVGSLTRAKIAQMCGGGSTAAPTIRTGLGGQTYSIGDRVIWTADLTNAPVNTRVCMSLIRQSDGLHFAFPPENSCAPVPYPFGNISVGLTGTLVSNSGYNLTRGTYRLYTQLYPMSPPTTGGKDAPALATHLSDTFTLIGAGSPAVDSLSASPSSGSAPLRVVFTVNNYAPQKGDFVDFGDGTQGTLGDVSNWQTAHTYTAPGDYAARFRKCTVHTSQKDCDGSDVIATATVVVSNPIGTSGNGSLTISTDASTPSQQIVPGGSSGVTLGVYKLRTAGEGVALQKLSLKLTSGKPADLNQVSIYDSAGVLRGTAIFAGNNITTTSTLSNPLSLPRDVDTTLIIKGDIAGIGPSQSGTPGDLIAVDFAGATGYGITTGSNITATGNTKVAGVCIFKSVPTISQVSLPTDGLVDGRLLRFKVTAGASGSVALGTLNFALNSILGASLSNISLYGYTDSGFSSNISGQGTGGLIGAQTASAPRFGISANSPVEIPAGTTYYFELRATVTGAGTGSAVATTLLGDSSYTGISAWAGQKEKGYFTWSPNDMGISQFSDADWTNSYGIPGLPASGIVQTRTAGGVVSSTPSFNATPLGGVAPLTVVFTSANVDGYTLSFGDGQTKSCSAGSCASVSHVYATGGAFYANMTSGNTSIGGTKTISVMPPTPLTIAHPMSIFALNPTAHTFVQGSPQVLAGVNNAPFPSVTIAPNTSTVVQWGAPDMAANSCHLYAWDGGTMSARDGAGKNTLDGNTGSFYTGALVQTITYTLACSSLSGDLFQTSITIYVSNPVSAVQNKAQVANALTALEEALKNILKLLGQ